MNKTGTVYWITGLSGAGKTTIGKQLYQAIKQKKENVIFLDGDILREVFGNDLGYSREERYQCAMRYAKICHMIAQQNIDVVICTISMFHEVRQWSRRNIEGYKEIYIRVPIEVLKRRDQKGLYSGIEDGTAEKVVGMDLELELPQMPDVIVDNDGGKTIEEQVQRLMQELSVQHGI